MVSAPILHVGRPHPAFQLCAVLHWKTMCFPKQLNKSHPTTPSPFSGSLHRQMWSEEISLCEDPGKEMHFFCCLLDTFVLRSLVPLWTPFTLVFRVHAFQIECWETGEGHWKVNFATAKCEALRNPHVRVWLTGPDSGKCWPFAMCYDNRVPWVRMDFFFPPCLLLIGQDRIPIA